MLGYFVAAMRFLVIQTGRPVVHLGHALILEYVAMIPSPVVLLTILAAEVVIVLLEMASYFL
jgi:hypothetical protein